MAKKGMNIYHRKDGRWEGRYKNGYTVDGKIKYSSVYGKSYSAVRDILLKRNFEITNNINCSYKYTVSELLNNWLTDIKSRVKESTYANYTMKINKHLLPRFSGMKYDMLTAEILNSFIIDKISCGLSEKYVADIIVLLKSAAKFAAKRYGYVNKIYSVDLPRSRKISDKLLLNAAEQHRLKSEIMKNTDYSNVGILLSMSSGLRIGELCALKWSDIDFEKSIITVRRTVQRICSAGGGTRLIISRPKSISSEREIPLPDFIVPLLKNIRTTDNAFLLSGNMKIIEPRTMQYRFKSLLKRAGLPYVNFHALRHMFATNCIAFGFDVKTLSEILGHSSVEITLNRYVHSSLERKRNCMKMFSGSFWSI